MSEEQIPHLLKTLETRMETAGVIYGGAMMRTAGPKRMRHLEQRLAFAEGHGLV